jgi:3-hydroxybutyryl-CoA dehydratase
MDPVTFYFEDLKIGMTAHFAKTIGESDINLFAGVSGDTNPIHIDEEYASATIFKGRIAHGMLSGALISTVLGTRLPGPGAVYVSQSLKFRAPVRAGDTLRAQVEITGLDAERKRVTLKTFCTVAGKVVVDGEAVLMVPSRG